MKRLIAIAVLMCFGLGVQAQNTAAGAATKNAQGLTNVMTPGKANALAPGSTIFTIPPKKGDRKGSPYLFESWNEGVVTIKSLGKVYKFEEMKYDIMNNDIELKVDGAVKVIMDQEVKEFSIKDQASGNIMTFIRMDGFTYEETPLVGFAQVVALGRVTLVKHFYTEIKEANYSIALNVGDKHDTILKREKFYLAYKNKLYDASKKKQLINFYSAQGKDAKTFIKENKINLKTEIGLATVINHFNEKK